MGDVGEEAGIAHHRADPRPERRNLVGPRTIMIEGDPLSRAERDPGDPEVPRIDEVRLPELATGYQARAAGEVPQRGGPKWGPRSKDGHTGNRRRQLTVCGILSRDMQPGVRGERDEVLGGSREDLRVRLGIRQRILESEQNLHHASSSGGKL